MKSQNGDACTELQGEDPSAASKTSHGNCAMFIFIFYKLVALKQLIPLDVIAVLKMALKTLLDHLHGKSGGQKPTCIFTIMKTTQEY